MAHLRRPRFPLDDELFRVLVVLLESINEDMSVGIQWRVNNAGLQVFLGCTKGSLQPHEGRCHGAWVLAGTDRDFAPTTGSELLQQVLLGISRLGAFPKADTLVA